MPIVLFLIFSTPGVLRSYAVVAVIERFFPTLTRLFLCTLSGHAPTVDAVKGKPVLKLAELNRLLRSFLLDDYHRCKHSENTRNALGVD